MNDRRPRVFASVEVFSWDVKLVSVRSMAGGFSFMFAAPIFFQRILWALFAVNPTV
jgi:hypothetical protein